jgi:regulator of nucleoside diphosphate kinase
MISSPIYLSPFDHRQLRVLIAKGGNGRSTRDLCSELDRAVIVAGGARVPPSVVTLDSTVTLEDHDTHTISEVVLALPEFAADAPHAVSVLDELGTALVGCGVGDVVTVNNEGWDRTLRIIRVVQSPLAKAAASLGID